MDHFGKEEQVVFPLMYVHDMYDRETVDLVTSMTEDHRTQEEEKESLQQRMVLFEGDRYATLHGKLEEFFKDLSIHISKEDEMAFPAYIDFVTKIAITSCTLLLHTTPVV